MKKNSLFYLKRSTEITQRKLVAMPIESASSLKTVVWIFAYERTMLLTALSHSSGVFVRFVKNGALRA